MAWQFDIIVDGHSNKVIDKLEDKLDGLNRNEGIAAKVGAADARHDQARAVIFWNEDYEEKPIPDPPNGPWAKQVWETTVDFNDICVDIRSKLNELSSSQAFYAKLVYTDAKYQPARFCIILAYKLAQ
jgi:hypothetical protein